MHILTSLLFLNGSLMGAAVGRRKTAAAQAGMQVGGFGCRRGEGQEIGEGQFGE